MLLHPVRTLQEEEGFLFHGSKYEPLIYQLPLMLSIQGLGLSLLFLTSLAVLHFKIFLEAPAPHRSSL